MNFDAKSTVIKNFKSFFWFEPPTGWLPYYFGWEVTVEGEALESWHAVRMYMSTSGILSITAFKNIYTVKYSIVNTLLFLWMVGCTACQPIAPLLSSQLSTLKLMVLRSSLQKYWSFLIIFIGCEDWRVPFKIYDKQTNGNWSMHNSLLVGTFK
jgi:hypothetical protein